MPRKKRQLKADLRKAGFHERSDRAKGSHSYWYHPELPDIVVILSGHDGDDAKPYDESHVRKAITEVKRRLS